MKDRQLFRRIILKKNSFISFEESLVDYLIVLQKEKIEKGKLDSLLKSNRKDRIVKK